MNQNVPLPVEVAAIVAEFRSDRASGQIILNFNAGVIGTMNYTRFERVPTPKDDRVRAVRLDSAREPGAE